MSEELILVTQLAIILTAAGIFTIICRALKQPLILGYIIAGFIVGPHLGLFPKLDATSVKQWSEIGIIFLLFGLGLEFSFRKLVKIGSKALITAGVITLGMFTVGWSLGQAMHWTEMESIFMGGLMSMSSTTIIIKSYTDMGLKEKPWASLIFGTLVFEDLIAVLMMVLLSTLAMTGKFSGSEMAFGIVKLVFFLILWFVVGIFAIPLLLRKVKKYLDDEILLLVGIALCFIMVVAANKVGFSSALGAFVMGSILAETIEGEHIAKITANVKDLFGAIFFVSVGMMVDPAIIAANWVQILVITVVAVAGLMTFSSTGSLLAGAGLDNAVHVGFSMAQLGEFSFIIAGLGSSLGVMRGSIYPIIIAVSVITTFTTPYMIKAGDPMSRFLRARLPEKLLAKLQAGKDKGSKSKAEKSEWKSILTHAVLKVVIYSVSIIAVMIVAGKLFPKYLPLAMPHLSDQVRQWVALGIILVVILPLLYGLVSNGSKSTAAMNLLIKKNRDNRWPLLAIIVLRSILAVLFILVLINSVFDMAWWVVLIISILLFFLFLFIAKFSMRRISLLEKTFLNNLNAKDEMMRKTAPVTSKFHDVFEGSEISLNKVVVSPDFMLAGKQIMDFPVKTLAGVNIVKIQRGHRSIIIPNGSERIFPGDILLVAGEKPQQEAFRRLIEDNTYKQGSNNMEEDFDLAQLTIDKENALCGKSIRDANVKKTGCMVISLTRDGKVITNPPADMVILEKDIVWLAGEKKSIEWFK